MISGDGPDNNDKQGKIFSDILDHLSSYWFYVFIALLFLIGLGLVGILGFWYIQQQPATIPVSATKVSAGNPRIAIQPPSAPPGKPLQVTGYGWPVGDVVFISLEAPSSQVQSDFAYAGAVVDTEGKFEVGFIFPEETRWSNAGAIKVVAWAEQSGVKAVTIFQVTPLTPVFQVESSGSPTVQLPKGTMQATNPAIEPFVSIPLTETTFIPAENWYGEYFGNSTLSESPAFLRDDQEIRFDWGEGGPGNNVGADDFSVRWTRYVPFTAGVYRFFIRADDGVRLWIDDRLTIDQWHKGSPTTYVADTYLWEGPHRVQLEYYEETDQASVDLWWEQLEIFPDWKAEYFDNTQLDGQPLVVRNDTQIHFNWENRPPVQGIRPGAFSVRWVQRIRFARGSYRFYVN